MTLFPLHEYTEFADGRTLHERLFLGSAGWSYDDWEGPFYPPGTSSRDRLSFYARQFRSVEIDSTFYGIPTKQAVRGWYDRTPEDFMFSAKFPSSITHTAQLIDCADEMFQFVEVMTELGEKLGPLLIQFPPTYSIAGISDLARFLESLPKGLIYAVEVRHRSWLVDEFADLLKHHNASIVMSCCGPFERFWRVTSRVAYIRWLGKWDAVEEFDRIQIDRSDEIAWWIPRIRHFLDQGGVLFGYVNNHYAGHSPESIRTIKGLLETELATPSHSETSLDE